MDRGLEKAATNEKREGRDRDKLGDKLEVSLKVKKRKMRQRVSWKNDVKRGSCTTQSYEAEKSLCNALREYVDSSDKDQGRARALMTKCWQ